MTGEMLWQRVVPGAGYLEGAARDGVLYLAGPNRVDCFAADTGASMWSVDLVDRHWPLPKLTVSDAELVLAGWDRLSVLRRDAGEPVWSRGMETERTYFRGPAVVECGIVAISSSRDCRAWRLSDGMHCWTTHLESSTDNMAEVAQRTGVVYAGTGDGALYALDLETGQPQWQTAGMIHHTTIYDGSVVSQPATIAGCPVVDDSRIIFDRTDGTLNCVDLTGNLLWQSVLSWRPSRPFPLPTRFVAPVRAGSVVAVMGESGTMTGWDVRDGKMVWSTGFPKSRKRRSHAATDDVICCAGDNIVIAIDARTGQGPDLL